jgi:hypothetical protein
LSCFTFWLKVREDADMVLQSMMTDDKDDGDNIGSGGGGYDG